jgi:hypothetical protein
MRQTVQLNIGLNVGMIFLSRNFLYSAFSSAGLGLDDGVYKASASNRFGKYTRISSKLATHGRGEYT